MTQQAIGPVWHQRGWGLMAIVLLACALAPLSSRVPAWLAGRADAAASTVAGSAASSAHEWPRTWDGRPIRPLAMSAVEQRFASRFPGAIGRFTDDERVLVLRHVTQPTRMLHPAADCFRGLGYQIRDARLVRVEGDATAHHVEGVSSVTSASRPNASRPDPSSASPASPALTRCFVAERDGEALRVCEVIVGRDGDRHTDASAWFWAASTGRSRGPWQAVTVVDAL